MSKIATGIIGTGAFGLGRRINFFLDGKDIGYWFCEGALRDEYGVFHPNEYFKSLLGENAYTGGDSGKVQDVLQRRIDKLWLD
jgi:hypothetical protein